MSDARTRDPSTDPFDPSGPFGEPGPVDSTGPKAVAGLDTALPLTMFPVRLATRLHRPVPGEPPTELWLRIFPDLIHADGHLPELSASEIAIGQSYWERLWRAAGDAIQRDDAHLWRRRSSARHRWRVGDHPDRHRRTSRRHRRRRSLRRVR